MRMKNGHVALVTGANKGIGKATARALAERGLTVLMGARCAERGATAAAELAQQGLSVVPVHLDVTSESDVSALAEMIGREYGRLDSLVNNAGVFVGARVTDTRLADFRTLFETNVFGAAVVINTLLPWLAAAAAPCIVNVSSLTASLKLSADGASLPGDASVRAAYTASKAALNMLTIQYDREFRTWPGLAHIKINSVTPGYTATDMNAFRGKRSVEQAATVIAELATNPPDESTGRFLGEDGVVPW
jgi:NAD(P)-dependent dehydrogenase (short-subunit alcohol dehydrogenase family)